MRTLLKTLTAAPGISGRENHIATAFSTLLMPYCDEIRRDNLGNVLAFRKGYAQDAPLLMLEAHLDKIGLMVRHITEDGFILFSPVGGFDTKVLPATGVRIYGKEVLHGVICSIPPHIASSDKAPDMDLLCVDTGLPPASVRSLIRIGDAMEFDTDFVPLGKHMAAASAMDDRAGLAVIVRMLSLLEKVSLPFSVALVGAVQEEVGMRGASAAAYALQPDAAFCIDVGFGRSPDSIQGTFPLGKGPIITVGPNVQRVVSDRFIFTAKAKNIPYQIDVDSGNTGTDAWPVQIVKKGVYTSLLSIPLRYMHTPYEVIDFRDTENTACLLAAVIEDLGRQGSLCF